MVTVVVLLRAKIPMVLCSNLISLAKMWAVIGYSAKTQEDVLVDTASNPDLFDAEIADGCVASCGLCEDDAPTASTAPASTPVSTPERTPAPTQGPIAATICPNGKSPFTITLMNMGNNTKFDPAFASAKAKWESIIKCNVDDYWKGFGDFDWFNGRFSEPFNGGVDGVVIGFSMEYIDGIDEEVNTLGSAGAVHVRGQGGSPLSGIMVFDEDDFASMSKSESATRHYTIIIHIDQCQSTS